MLKSPKSCKNQEISGQESCIQISAVALTPENYTEYHELIPSLNRLQTLASYNQPEITEIPADLPDSLNEINITETGLQEIRA